MIIDADQHIHEPRTMWRDYADPAAREDALEIADDERGYPWLTWHGERLYLAEIQHPGQATRIGDERLRIERGEPAEAPYDDALPPAYTDPKARVARLDEWGLDAAVVLPNFGLLWEEMLAGDLPALCSNMRAFNRWMADVVRDGGGRLHGVAHMTLRDPDWVRSELASLARAGIRLAMVAPAIVDGKALAHPDLDPVWSAFEQHDVAPVFHVGGFRQPLDPAWYEADPEPVDKVMASVLLWVAPAAALANMAIHGVFERHPRLRVGVIELTAHWVPQFLLMLDGAWGFYAARHGRSLTDLPLRPSEYLRRQVRIGVLAYEQPGRLISDVGEDMFMFGSDWPHAEGIAEPLGVYERVIEDVQGEARAKLLGGNAAWLLRTVTEVPERVRELMGARQEARAAKDFAAADAIRDQIAAAGYTVRDTPEGPVAEPAARYEVLDPASIPNVLTDAASLPFSFHLLYEGFLEDLERFLRGFEQHCDTARAEVVVVDNASADAEQIEALAPGSWTRVLHLARPLGWAAARNAGLKIARGAIVVLADLSLEPAGELLAPLQAAFDDPGVAVAGPFGLVSADMRAWHEVPGPGADVIEGYLLATRRELLAQGLIHERFAWYRNADIDLSFQLRAGGGAARVVPLPVVKHTHRGWNAVDDATREKLSKRNHYTFFDRWKHRPDLLTTRDQGA